MTVEQVDVLTRKLQTKVYHETGVILVGVGVYSYNTKNNEISKIYNTIQETVMAYNWVLQIHGFYVDIEKKEIRFDIVMSFEIEPKEGIKIIREKLVKIYPEYKFQIIADVDISD